MASARTYPTQGVAHPPAIGLVSNQGSFLRVPSTVLEGQGRVQGGLQGGGVQSAPCDVVVDVHVEAQLQDYRSKLQQYKAQLQTLAQETPEGPQGGLQEGPQGEPQGELQGDSSVAPTAVVALEAVPTAVACLVAASAVAEAREQMYIAAAGSSLAEAPKGERAASADKLGRRDLASSTEVWHASQAPHSDSGDDDGDDDGDGGGGDDGDGGSGGGDDGGGGGGDGAGGDGADGDGGVAADLIELSRGSTAGTIVDVSVVDVVEDDDAAHTEEQGPMTEGDLLEACSACPLRTHPTHAATHLHHLEFHSAPSFAVPARITSLNLPLIQVLHSAYRHVNSTLHTLLEGDNL